jgi:drug/metabolite transporter (DMT)-like permease
LALLALGAIWGASFLFMRIAVPEFGALPMAAVRVSVGALFLLPILLSKGGFAPLSGRFVHLAILSLMTQSIPFGLFSYAAAHQPAGTSAILNATVPFFGALIGALGFGTVLKPRAIVGIICGFCGVVLLILNRGNGQQVSASILPVLACLVASCCYGFAANFARRHFTGVDPLAITTGSQLISICLLAPFALATAPEANPSLLAWMCVVTLGVLCTAIAYLIYYRLIRNAGPTFTMSVTYLVPMFGVVWSAMFLHEPITLVMLLAGGVILLGVALTVRA